MISFPHLPSADFDSATHLEIMRLLSRLKEQGIDEVRSGIELEMRITADMKEASPDEPFFKKRKEELMRSAESKPQATQIAKFNKAELFYYDVINDPRIRDWLEPITEEPVQKAKHFYDGRDRMELRLKHEPVQKLLKRYEDLKRILSEKLEAYNYQCPTGFHHQSFSFWKDGKNTTLSEHPEYDRYTPAITAGIAHSLYYGFGLVVADCVEDETPVNFVKPATTRADYMRMAKGRIEVRTQGMRVFPDCNPFITSMLALAGAAFALDAHPTIRTQFKSSVVPVTKVLKAIYQNPHPDLDPFRLTVHESRFNKASGHFKTPKRVKQGLLQYQAGHVMLKTVDSADDVVAALTKHDRQFREGEWKNIQEFMEASLQKAPLLHEVDKDAQDKPGFAHVKSVDMARSYRPVHNNSTNAALFFHAPVFDKMLSPGYLRLLKQFVHSYVPDRNDAEAKKIIEANNKLASRLQARKKDESKSLR